ncbi:MAG: UvrB/UvrC motif-containing protein [Puniceicoccaceae bacterium]
MARPEKCSDCTKPTTIHLTQIVDGKIMKLDICEDCVFKDQVVDPLGFSLADILSVKGLAIPSKEESIFEEDEIEPGLKCGACGCTMEKFEAGGRLGCESCFDVFGKVLKVALPRFQYGIKHCGKQIEVSVPGESRHEERSRLLVELEQAVQEERYEDAARLRDEIRGAGE